MTIKKIIDYLENPKVIRTFKGSTLDGMNEVEFDTDTLKEMISKLNDSQLNDLLGKVLTVCEQWNALRVAPGNDIGTIARYQEARHFLEANPTTGIGSDRDVAV